MGYLASPSLSLTSYESAKGTLMLPSDDYYSRVRNGGVFEHFDHFLN